MNQHPMAHAARCAFDHLPDSGGPGRGRHHHPGWAARRRYAVRLDLGCGPDGNRQTWDQPALAGTDTGAWIFR
jgi:hypothetical protein